VTGNDDRTGEVRVELVEPPDLRELELEVRSPVYTGVAPRKIRRGMGTIDVPEDSGIVLTGLATKDLAEARILLDQQPAGTCRIQGTGPEARRRIEGQLLVRAPQPYRPCVTCAMALRDVEGFENAKAASYNFILRQDQPPTIHVEAVQMGGEITATALVPLIVTARDDYGITALQLEWSVQSAPQKTQLELLKTYLPAAPEPGALPCSFDLRQVAAREASNAPPLQVGETLRLQAVALDTRPLSAGGAHKAVSNLVTFRIVTAEELLAKGVETQRALREQIRQTLEMQTDIRERCRSAAGQAQQPTTLGLALREVAGAADTQQQIEDLLTGAVGRLEALLEQLRNNRALTGEDELRLRASVAEPLRKVIRELVGPLVRKFEAAKTLTRGGDLAAELNGLAAIQDQVIRVLEAVVAEMIKVENAQHIEGNLRALIKLSDQVRETMKAKQPVDEAPPKVKPQETQP
jgi:uncharacterized coiled-coil protein SlyX